MGSISKNDGRTILFVSHNMASIKLLCNNALLLNNGMIYSQGNTEMVINTYKKLVNNISELRDFKFENEFFTIKELSYSNEFGTNEITINNEICFTILIDFKADISGIAMEIFVKNDEELIVFSGYTDTLNVQKGLNNFNCIIPKNILNNTNYNFTFGISKNYSVFLAKFDDIIQIDVENQFDSLGWQGKVDGVIRPKLGWKLNNKTI